VRRVDIQKPLCAFHTFTVVSELADITEIIQEAILVWDMHNCHVTVLSKAYIRRIYFKEQLLQYEDYD
jgi:hypothetical protein